jgi:Protein of unknown function (DUF3047)
MGIMDKSVTGALFSLVAAILLSVQGCASIEAQKALTQSIPTDYVPPLMRGDGSGISDAWRPVTLPLKRKTDYKVVRYEGKNAVKAHARSSASGMEAKLNIDLATGEYLSFSWFAEGLIEGADNAQKETEDSPLRIILSFDGDKGTLSAKEQRFHERAKLLSGRELPYATLMYIWENKKQVDEVITNPHTSTIRKIVICSGTKDLKKWIAFKRNVIKDYTAAFGKPPGKLTGIALMSDTDNTSTDITAYYGDIKLTNIP